METPLPPEDIKKKMEEELVRLQEKRLTVKDADILGALNLRVNDLQTRLARIQTRAEEIAKEAEAEENFVLPDPPTPEQSAVAENLIRQARVAKMRHQPEEVRRLLSEARVAAPGSVAVLELLGDEYAEVGQKDKALECFRFAMKLNPNNVAIEKKHANLVFNLKAKPQSDMDSFNFHMAEIRDNAKGAKLRSALLPGLGQVSLGQLGLGYTFMAIWGIFAVWLLIKLPDFKEFLVHILKSHTSANDTSFVIPLIGLFVTYLLAIGLASAGQAEFKGVEKKSHPAPPVNLPFE